MVSRGYHDAVINEMKRVNEKRQRTEIVLLVLYKTIGIMLIAFTGRQNLAYVFGVFSPL